jgi:hypothetical protein
MSTPVLIGLIVTSLVVGVFLLVMAAHSARIARTSRPCAACGRAMLPAWQRCMFCGWEPVARLEFIHGPLAGQTIRLIDHVTTIGSASGNGVVLPDPAVSRKHAGIRRTDGEYELADFGSTNGVYVNGQKVPKCSLSPGDIVRVGNSEAVFHRE